MSDISKKIKAVTAKHFELASWFIQNDTTLSALGADSLDAIGLIMVIEIELGFNFPKDAFSSSRHTPDEMTFGEFARIVETSISADMRQAAE